MPISDGSVTEDILLEFPITKYDIFFFGGTLKGEVEIRLFSGNDNAIQVASVRFFNNMSILPKDEYSRNIIFLNTHMATLDAIIHKLENSIQKIIHFSSTIPAATLKFD
jgi:hypothetical protein